MKPPSPRPHRRWSLLVMAVLMAGCSPADEPEATAGSGATQAEIVAPGPPPPLPDLQAVDPELADHLRRARRRLHEDAGNPNAWLGLGMGLDAAEFDELAVDCYRAATVLDPAEPRSWYLLALLQERRGLLEDAERALRTSAALASRYAPARWRLGFLLLEQGRPQDAEPLFEAAIDIDAGDSVGWVGLARAHLDRGRIDDAIEVLQSALESVESNRSYMQYLLGVAYRRAGRREEARAALALGQSEPPLWSDPWQREIGKLRTGYYGKSRAALEALRNGRDERAVALLEQLVREHPDKPIKVHLARAYFQRGRGSAEGQSWYQKSIAVLNEVIEQSPDAYPAHFQLAAVYADVARRVAPDRAEAPRNESWKHVKHVLALVPSFAQGHALVGDLHRDEQDLDAANIAYREALRCDPGNPRWLGRAGFTELQRGAWTEAAELLDRLIRVRPRNREALRARCIALIKLGRLDEAAEVLAAARALGDDATVLEGLQTELDAVRAAQEAGGTTNATDAGTESR